MAEYFEKMDIGPENDRKYINEFFDVVFPKDYLLDSSWNKKCKSLVQDEVFKSQDYFTLNGKDVNMNLSRNK